MKALIFLARWFEYLFFYPYIFCYDVRSDPALPAPSWGDACLQAVPLIIIGVLFGLDFFSLHLVVEGNIAAAAILIAARFVFLLVVGIVMLFVGVYALAKLENEDLLMYA